MRLVCVTQRWWDKYIEICEHRKALVPWATKTALFVAERDELVAGVLIYDTQGPYLFFEHLVTNQTATYRQRHQAVQMMAKEMMSYSRTVGKVPLINVQDSHKGLQRALRRAGLQTTGARTMTCPIELLS